MLAVYCAGDKDFPVTQKRDASRCWKCYLEMTLNQKQWSQGSWSNVLKSCCVAVLITMLMFSLNDAQLHRSDLIYYMNFTTGPFIVVIVQIDFVLIIAFLSVHLKFTFLMSPPSLCFPSDSPFLPPHIHQYFYCKVFWAWHSLKVFQEQIPWD